MFSKGKPPPIPNKDDKKDVTPQTPKTPDTKKEKAAPINKDALKALNSGISDAIVDIKVSINELQVADLSRNGYDQLLQEDNRTAKQKAASTIEASTFGNRASLWTWRRSHGTCSGRLKPIIDVQLDSSASSSDLVLSGYVCDPVPISGQYFWIKRATNEEEEKDAIVDLFVTTGKMKDTTDSIWTSPAVGWIRVDGNFSKSMFGSIDSILWFRPARTRSLDSHMSSPIRSSVALTDEVRQTKLLAATRLALRHYVPLQDMKRLANLVMETSGAGGASSINTNIIRSERMLDFSNLFHDYQLKGKLTATKLTKMLYDVGIKLNRGDLTYCFNHFDANHGGFISIEEYTKILSLTDYELDLAVEKIRVKLLSTSSNPASSAGGFSKIASKLSAAVSKPSLGVLGAGSITAHANMGRNKIRENMTMIHVFATINVKNDAILSLDEVMDLASKMEVFLTEEEARKVLLMMDIDGDDRVEEADFVAFMRKESNSIVKKAFRVRESAAMLRRWLIRGTSEKITSTATATASKQQWKEFKHKYEKFTDQKFPGYLSAQVLTVTLAAMGIRLSAIEARELTLLMAPEKNGRIHQSDLHAFMGRNCRSYGELIAVMEREVLCDLLDSFRAHNSAIRATGKEDPDLADNYRRKLDLIKKGVENVFNKPPPVVPTDEHKDEHDEEAPPAAVVAPVALEPKYRKVSHEVISIAQLKAGIEDVFKDDEIPEGVLPNLEEWAALIVLVDADVAEGDIYGVKLKLFLEGLCAYAVSAADEARSRAGEKVSLEVVSRDLRHQIYTEARANGRAKKPDYRAVFDLFDVDKSGSLGLDELKGMLRRLQLVSALPDHQIPALLALFDKQKRGVVSFDDFAAFAEEFVKHSSGGRGPNGETLDGIDSPGGNMHDGDSDFEAEEGEDVDDDLEGMTTNIPPVAVTRNADCDYLLWILYRQACKVEPTDPESVITELEALCAETEMIVRNQASISTKEFWNILFEKRLQGGLSKSQFIKGVQVVCSEGSGRDDDRVDYETLCRHVVRMGRGFNQVVQERAKMDEGAFAPLVADLKKYFKDLSEEKPADRAERGSGPSRYEKIFRRLDSDGDGMLTMREFRQGLRRLHYKNEKSWTSRMVRRLFDECDKNRDGLLSIKEFNAYVLDSEGTQSKLSIARSITQGSAGRGRDGRDRDMDSPDKRLGQSRRQDGLKEQEDKLNLSDDEEDEVFRKHRTLTDHELIKKVNEVLHDIVPVEENSSAKHIETVRNSVRRFFLRADPDHKGVVSEERFRAFLRRSTLQDSLTASELRRLTDKLKKRATGREKEVLVDYEKLVQLLSVAVESIPKSKAESIFARFQEAAHASAVSGRPFPIICSLVDLRLTGRLTREELVVAAKMMDCPLSLGDVEAMLEMFPANVLNREGLIDYRIIQNLLQSYSPHQPGGFGGASPHSLGQQSFDLDPRLGRSVGALPAYATPGQTLNASMQSNEGLGRWQNRTISTPMGGTLTTPFSPFNDALSNRPGGIANTNSSHNLINGRASYNMFGGGANTPNANRTYEMSIRGLLERIRMAQDEQSSQHGSQVSIRRQFEAYDNDGSGLISSRTLQAVLDDIDIALTSSDLQCMYHLYGRPEDDKIYYDALCRAVDSPQSGNISQRPGTAPGALGATLGGGGGGDTYIPYLNARVLQRLQELRQEGRSPRDIFEAADLDNSGLVTTHKFKDIVVKLQLLSTEHQLAKALEDYTNISNRSYVLYQDFCDALDRAASGAESANLRASTTSLRRSGPGFVYGSGYDGTRSVMEQAGDEPLTVFDSLQRFRSDNVHTPSHNVLRDYPNELEEGSDGFSPRGYPLSPPKVSDSLSIRPPRRGSNDGVAYWNNGGGSPQRFSVVGTPGGGGGYNSPGRYSRSVHEESPRRSTTSIAAPRTSPSKVGSRMWGNSTPLNKKGQALRVGDDKWCCAVCLYVENSIHSTTCAVCDSPNYNNNKDYQVKEQCNNCTYQNGQFAEECEMCGEPLSHRPRPLSSSHSNHQPESSFKIRDGTNRSSRDYY